MPRTGVMRAVHLFGLAKQPFCFALELFSLCRSWPGSGSSATPMLATSARTSPRKRASSRIVSS